MTIARKPRRAAHQEPAQKAFAGFAAPVRSPSTAAEDAANLPDMTGAEFRALVGRLGFAQSGQANDAGLSGLARLLDRTPRTVITEWTRHGPPREVALLLWIMDAGKLDPAAVLSLALKAAKRQKRA